MSIGPLSGFMQLSNFEALASGLDSVAQGVSATLAQTASVPLDQIIQSFAPPGLVPPAGSATVAGAAEFPTPANFLGAVSGASPHLGAVRDILADPAFDPMAGLAQSLGGVFDGGLLNRLIGQDGLLNPLLGGLSLVSPGTGDLSGQDAVGRRTMPDGLDEVGRRTMPDGLDEVGRRTMPGGLDEVGRRTMPDGLDEVGRRTMPDGLDEVGRRTMPDGLEEVGRRTIPDGLEEVGRRTLPGGLDEVGRRTIPDGLEEVGRRTIPDGLEEVGRRTLPGGLDEVGRRARPGGLDGAGRRAMPDGLDEVGRRAVPGGPSGLAQPGIYAGIEPSPFLEGLTDTLRNAAGIQDPQSAKGLEILGHLRDQLGALGRLENGVRDLCDLKQSLDGNRLDGGK